MALRRPLKNKTHRVSQRPPFERIALLLQGGGALGSYQAGVYQALAEADLHPDWVAGISIGAINSALIAGNPPEKRVEALRAFWEAITAPPIGLPSLVSSRLGAIGLKGDFAHGLVNQTRAFATLMGGAPGFFTPRPVPPFLSPAGSVEAESFYDVAPLKATLERLVDFDRINAGAMRFSVGAVNVRTGNFEYFDTTTHVIRPEHVMASGALPPGFPATRIDGEYYWDGGLVSNTPLQWVLDSSPAPGHAGLPGGSVERARRVSARPDRPGTAPEGYPLLQPHPRGHRPVQEGAAAAPRARPSPEDGARDRAAARPTRRPGC